MGVNGKFRVFLGVMKKRANSTGKNGVYDFHFVVKKTKSMEKFVKDADDADRAYVAQFRRMIEDKYENS